MTRRYVKRDLYKKQKVEHTNNIIFIICEHCSNIYEEETGGVDSNYQSISVCPHCSEHNCI